MDDSQSFDVLACKGAWYGVTGIGRRDVDDVATSVVLPAELGDPSRATPTAGTDADRDGLSEGGSATISPSVSPLRLLLS